VKVEANPLWPHYTDFPKLAGVVKADIAVVGGGIAGVSCAYFLGTKGYKVVLLETNQIGSVATGASSGTLFYGCGLDFQQSIKRLGLNNAKLLFHETSRSIKEMIALIKKENIQCSLREPGIIYISRNEGEAEYIKGEERASAELGFPGKILSGDKISEIFTGRRFLNGVEHFCAQIHPGQFVCALSSLACAAHGVQIYENTEMLNFEENNKNVILKTSGGKVIAEKIVMATNTNT
jgi:glycine/D-amino acid oxidase-like deaminating enzyme